MERVHKLFLEAEDTHASWPFPRGSLTLRAEARTQAIQAKPSDSSEENAQHGNSVGEKFRAFANATACHVGTPSVFFVAVTIVVVWALTGPLFHFSDTWQLVINTGTTVVTFLMVFLIQSTQNRDAQAIHLKLDELIRATKNARNVFASLEDATEDEIKAFAKEFRELRQAGRSAGDAAALARERAAGRKKG